MLSIRRIFIALLMIGGWGAGPLSAQSRPNRIPSVTTLTAPGMINPAAVSARGKPELIFQLGGIWPRTAPVENYSLSVSSPVSNSRGTIGVDAQFQNDLGITNQLIIMSYGFHAVEKDDVDLHFGLRGGLLIEGRDFSDFFHKDPQPGINSTEPSSPVVGFGLDARLHKFSLGFSVPQLIFSKSPGIFSHTFFVRAAHKVILQGEGQPRWWELESIAQFQYHARGVAHADLLPLFQYKSILSFGPVLRLHFGSRVQGKNQTVWPGNLGGMIKVADQRQFRFAYGFMLPVGSGSMRNPGLAINQWPTWTEHSLTITYQLKYQ